mgnify:FL=1
MIIYLESTINLLISSGEKEKVEELIKSGQVKETDHDIVSVISKEQFKKLFK